MKNTAGGSREAWQNMEATGAAGRNEDVTLEDLLKGSSNEKAIIPECNEDRYKKDRLVGKGWR
jgi:hypothetical protein